jgi:hypothetical protein
MAELARDHRPVCTLWRRKLRACEVFVVQGEGGFAAKTDVDAVIAYLTEVTRSCGPFATMYDFTDGIQGLLPHVPSILDFARALRGHSAGRQLCTLVVCPDQATRSWARWLLRRVASDVPWHIVADVDAAWDVLERPDAACSDVFGDVEQREEEFLAI